MAGRLAGKVAIITGASRGLGQYCALEYGKEGAKVVVAARTEVESNPRLPGTIYETAKLIADAGGEAFPVVCNVADYDSVEGMVKQVVDKYGRVDVLMTNAAVQPPGTTATMQVRHWELEFRVNVNGPFYCVRAVLPQMQAQHSGNIINISSVAADAGRGGHYGAGKRAVESMTIGLAAELKADGIAVNCLKPSGGIATPGFMFGREGRDTSGALPPDSYVEAAVLLAMQTAASCTGEVFTDAEVVERFADAATRARVKAATANR